MGTVVRWHFSTVCNHHVYIRLVIRSRSILNLTDHVHAFDDMPKDNMFAVKMGRWLACNKELASIGVGTGCQRRKRRKKLSEQRRTNGKEGESATAQTIYKELTVGH